LSYDAGRLMVASVSSGSGKTMIASALMRLLRRRGLAVRPIKAGPDYLDSFFHMLAVFGRMSSRHASQTSRMTGYARHVDLWAMHPQHVASLLAEMEGGGDKAGPAMWTVAEGVMGLFDEGLGHKGTSTADIARLFSMPILLVVHGGRMGASIGALVQGFCQYRDDIEVAGVIVNGVSTRRHRQLIKDALDAIGVVIYGFVPRSDDMVFPSKRLGLAPVLGSRDRLIHANRRLDAMADHIEEHVDVDGLMACMAGYGGNGRRGAKTLAAYRPLFAGSHVSVAYDEAFCFVYDWMVAHWKRYGRVDFFSPLRHEVPSERADVIFLPGGYPEDYALSLSQNRSFFSALGRASQRGAFIYGECGGFMVLGKGLIDGDGKEHRMADMLPVVTSMREPSLTLGYRRVVLACDTPLGARGVVWRGHEFHYGRIVTMGDVPPLFHARGLAYGMAMGRVAGSYIHVIDRERDSVTP